MGRMPKELSLGMLINDCCLKKFMQRLLTGLNDKAPPEPTFGSLFSSMTLKIQALPVLFKIFMLNIKIHIHTHKI